MDKLNAVFDRIHADDALKNKTKSYLAQYSNQRPFPTFRQAVAVGCILLLILGGHWVYFTPTAQISIDINPSVELGINRFDRVVSANGSNSDGKELLENMNLIHLNYTDAVEQILDNPEVMRLLSDGELLSVGVIGAQGGQTARILTDVQACSQDANCYVADAEEAERACAMGLSHGKYRAFLELQALDPGVTVEQVRGMSMRQIRDWIEALQSGEPTPTLPKESVPDSSGSTETTRPGHHGNGQGNANGNGHGTGK